MMKHKLLILLGLLIAIGGHAQNDQSDINEQVWKPFTQAIMTQDVNRFIALHSSDLVRAVINNQKLMGWNEYRMEMEKSWPGWKESIRKNKSTYTFELRFTERISNGNVAYEVGYFRNQLITATGETQESFGRFHVVLRKEAGAWKILVDSDSNEGGTITAEMFMTAKSLE
jgi:ketosteroid isomerase-like protein